MDQHEDVQELLTRLNNIRDSMEATLGYTRGIEDGYQLSLLQRRGSRVLQGSTPSSTNLEGSY